VRAWPFLLVAALCAAAHAAGILFGQTLWRYAEVLCLALLLLYGVARGLRPPRWAVPAALVVLLADAVRTLPPGPAAGVHAWKILQAGPDADTPSGFESGLALCWAPLTAAVLLLVAARRRPSPGALVPAALVVGYAVVRVVDVAAGIRSRHLDGAVPAVILAVLPAVALGLAASALSAAPAGQRRWLAAAGAALLVVVAAADIGWSIDAVPLPLYRATAFSGKVITPTLTMPQPVAAFTAAAELTAYLLLVAGMTGSRGAGPAVGEGPAPGG
jgi:hypothetical protein